MKGLEISEVRLSNLERTSRLDSEFYKRENIKLDKILSKCESICDCADVSDGNHMSISDKFSDEGIPYYRGQDISSFFIENADSICIDEDTFNANVMQRSHLAKGDVLLSIVGTIGGVSVVSTDNKATCSCKIAILRPKIIDGYYLSIFLSCKYGQQQIDRLKRGAVQMGLILEDMDQIRVSCFPLDFQSVIHTCVEKAKIKVDMAQSAYASAEQLLLSSLGLDNWQPKDEKTTVKMYSEYERTGRLDAEYYQPKYEEIEEKLHVFERAFIKDLVKFPVASGSTPKAGDDKYYTTSDEGVPFLRAVDIVDSRVDTSDLIYINKDVHNGILKHTQLCSNDVLFSIAGTVGRCGIFDYDFEANINQAVAILRFDEVTVNRIYLIMFFNSCVGKLLVKKYSRQGLQTNLNLEEVGNLYVPIIDMSIQQQIATKVQDSFRLRRESKELLERAKRAVEIAIEEGEERAMAWLEQKTKNVKYVEFETPLQMVAEEKEK